MDDERTSGRAPFRTSDAGQSWQVTSPDLSTQDPSRLGASGGLVGDNLGQFYGEVVYDIAPSDKQKGLIWAGTNDGKLWYTTDGGGRWSDVTRNIPGLPAWGTIAAVQPSFFDAATAYIAVDFHINDNRDPYIFRTHDFGKTWKRIDADLPRGELAYVRTISQDPHAKGLLFAGTGNAFYYSIDEGDHWTRLKQGLPSVPVTWSVVQKRFHDLVISTWGRGFYILPDVTPLEQMANERELGKRSPDVRLFSPRPSYRLPRNPTAFINFALKTASGEPARIEIVDADGKIVRILHHKTLAGFNRVVWDMRYEPLETVRLRTTPTQNPFIWDEPRFKGKRETRTTTQWGMAARQKGPIVLPGIYQVRLTIDERTQTAPIEVLADPESPGTATDLKALRDFQLRVADDVGRTAEMINTIEWLRRQLEDLQPTLNGKFADLKQKTATWDGQLQKVEYELLNADMAPSDDKYYTSAYKVYFNLQWLYAGVNGNVLDMAGAGEQKPTDTMPAMLDMIEKDLRTASLHYGLLMATDVPAFNRELRAMGLTGLNATLPRAKASDEAEEEDTATSEGDGGEDADSN